MVMIRHEQSDMGSQLSVVVSSIVLQIDFLHGSRKGKFTPVGEGGSGRQASATKEI